MKEKEFIRRISKVKDEKKEFKFGRLVLSLALVTIFIAIASYVLDKFFLVY